MNTTKIDYNQLIKTAKPNQENEIKNFIMKCWKSLHFSDEFIRRHSPGSMNQYWYDFRSDFQVLDVENSIKATISFCPLFWIVETDICFLKNFYVRHDLRNNGIGKWMLYKCMLKAREFGYRLVYLESLKLLDSAMRLYERYGFRKLPAALILTGNPSNVFMIANIEEVIGKIEIDLKL